MTAIQGEAKGQRDEQKGKRTHGHGQLCGDCWGKGSIRGLNGNGKKYNKDKEVTYICITFKCDKGQSWRTNYWLPGVKDGGDQWGRDGVILKGESEGDVCDYEIVLF